MRYIEKHGRTATKIVYGTSGTDTHGDPEYSTTSSTVQVIYNRRSGAVSADASGPILDTTADVYIDSDETVDDAEATVRATTFKLDEQRYKVLQKDPQQDLTKLICQRENE